MTQKIVIGVLVATTLLFGFFAFKSGALSFGKASGAAHFQMESFLQGVSAGARDQFSVSNGGVLTTSGDITSTGGANALVLTSSNTATSSATIGCVTTYATSTATPIRFVIGSAVVGTTTYQGTGIGSVEWMYGTCP